MFKLHSKLATVVAAAFVAATFSCKANAFETPKLQSHVNDYAHVLSEPDRRALDKRLSDYENATQGNPQVVILTVPSLPEDAGSMDDYKNKVFHDWKLGHKDNNNGVLTVVSMDHKIGIEVGYDLEPAVTDTVSQSAIDRMKPSLRTGNFKQAFNDELNVILPVITQYQTDTDAKNHPKAGNSTSHSGALILFTLFCMALVAFVIWRLFFKKTDRPIEPTNQFPDSDYPRMHRNSGYARDPYARPDYNYPVYPRPTAPVEPEKPSSPFKSAAGGFLAGVVADEVLNSGSRRETSRRRDDDDSSSSSWGSSSSSDYGSSSSSDSSYSGDSGSSGGGGSSDSW